MLINTYMKTLRKEKVLLQYNLITVIASVVLTFVSCKLMHNLEFAVLSIILLLAFRSTIAEIYLSKTIGIRSGKTIMSEHIMAVSFIIANWFIGGIAGMLMYVAVYAVFLLANKKDFHILQQYSKRIIPNR